MSYDMREDNFSSIWEVSLNFTTACSEIGIKIEEGTNKAFDDGIFISDVQDGSPACLGGVQIGDMLLAVNNVDSTCAISLEPARSSQQNLSEELMVKSG